MLIGREVLGELLRIRRVVVQDLDLVTSRDDAGSNATAHVACTNDRHSCHGAASSGSCRPPNCLARRPPCKPGSSSADDEITERTQVLGPADDHEAVADPHDL
jgi:hypothetical protein